MADQTVDRDPVEYLAAEFVERLRRGEYPSVEEYASAHPAQAEEIRELFPTIAAMEKLKSDKESLSGGRASLGPTKLERLGDLRIIREIGRGGMGIVYEAEQESLGRRVAVKVLPKQSLLDDKHLRRFRREAKTAARLHHTNIVPVLGVGEQDGYHYYVMQIIRGVGLDEVIPHLGTFRNGNGSGARQNVTADRKRAENVSSVARAMVDGDLLRLAAGAESSELASGSTRVLTPSTDSPGTGATAEYSPDASDAAARSFVLAADTASDDETVESGEHDLPVGAAGRFGTAYWQSVARIGIQVSNALHYAHRQGTLHRDIKPANLLIDDRGNVWVADFGLAKAMEQEQVSHSGDVVGTLRYMAPEQFQAKADDRSDIFSLGLTLYELITLRPAYNEAERKHSFVHGSGQPDPTPPRRINSAIPRDLETIVLKAIAPEPHSRYASAADLAEDLQRFIEDRPILARRASVPERLWRWARRNPAIASLSAVAASALLLVAIVSTVAYFRTEEARELAELERQAAQRTSRVALAALDKIFERLAPHRYVSPEDFALTTEGEETLPVDTQPVLSEEAAALLTEMMKSYDELAQISGQNSELLKSVALANRRLGDIHSRLGQWDQALADYQNAITAYESLDDESLEDPRMIAAIASVYNEIGHVLRRNRRFENWASNQDKAQEAYDKAKQLLEPIAVSGSPPAVRYELARTYYAAANRFGGPPSGGRGGRPRRKAGSRREGGPGGPPGPSRPAEQGGPPERGPYSGRDRNGERRSRENLNKAVELLEELTREYDVPDYKQLLALCYVGRHMHRRRDRSEDGVDSVAKAIELLEGLVERYPLNPDYGFTLCRVYLMSTFMSDPEDRLESIQTALSILKQLHDQHPNVPDYLLTQTWVHREAARSKLRIGDFAGAFAHFDEARKIGESLGRESSGSEEMEQRFTVMRKAEFALRLAEQIQRTELVVPEEYLVRARDTLLQAESDWKALGEGQGPSALRPICSRLAIIYGALDDEEAKRYAEHRAEEASEQSAPFDGEGRGREVQRNSRPSP